MKIWDQFKSKSLTKQIFLMVSVVFIVFFLVYNSLMIYTKHNRYCLLYTSPSPRDLSTSRMPSSA